MSNLEEVYISRIVSAPHISTLYQHAGNRREIIDNDGKGEKGEWIMRRVLAPLVEVGGWATADPWQGRRPGGTTGGRAG